MGQNISKIIIKIIALMYALAVLYITILSPYRYSGMFDAGNVNLRPFSDKWVFISNFPNLRDNQKLFIIKEIGGNFLLLVPFTWFIYAFFNARIKKVKMAFFLVLVALCIENLQFWLRIGTFDIDDIILNIAGGLLGFFLFDVVHKRNSIK